MDSAGPDDGMRDPVKASALKAVAERANFATDQGCEQRAAHDGTGQGRERRATHGGTVIYSERLVSTKALTLPPPSARTKIATHPPLCLAPKIAAALDIRLLHSYQPWKNEG